MSFTILTSFLKYEIGVILFLCRNLVNLEATGDPAWDGISYHASFISQRLNSCRDEHIAAEITAGEDTGKNWCKNGWFFIVLVV